MQHDRAKQHMDDSHMLELMATGASLVADFLKLRQERGESIDAKAFQDWLKHEAFPQLLADSNQTLQSVISLKADHHERYDELLHHVLAIRRAVAGPTPADEWSALSELERGLLTHVYQQSRDDPLIHADEEELQVALQTDEATIAKCARYLSERGWLNYSEHSGGSSISPQPAGVILAWAMSAPREHQGAIDRLARSLPSDDEADHLGTLAETADVPLGLTYFVISFWAQQGHLTFDDDASPFDGGLVHHVRETFRRSTGLS
jgi:hypothetical protein